jgi:hypothetical protein
MNKTQIIQGGGMHRRGTSPKRTGQIISNSGLTNSSQSFANHPGRAKSSGNPQYDNIYNSLSSAAPASGVNVSLTQIPKKQVPSLNSAQGTIPIR